MIHVDFVGVEHLPEVQLDPDAGPVTAALADRGVGNLRSAARLLHAMPYGPNEEHDALACLRDDQGTCTTKHATIVACAREVGVDVEWILGVYALDRTISRDVGPVLDRVGLPFVPTVHCFLRVGGIQHVDLTEGNCNGKDRQITNYLRLAVATRAEDELSVRNQAIEELVATDPAFSDHGVDKVAQVVTECHAAMHLACRRPPDGVPVATARGAGRDQR